MHVVAINIPGSNGKECPFQEMHRLRSPIARGWTVWNVRCTPRNEVDGTTLQKVLTQVGATVHRRTRDRHQHMELHWVAHVMLAGIVKWTHLDRRAIVTATAVEREHMLRWSGWSTLINGMRNVAGIPAADRFRFARPRPNPPSSDQAAAQREAA